jgi:hypothetical protein
MTGLRSYALLSTKIVFTSTPEAFRALLHFISSVCEPQSKSIFHPDETCDFILIKLTSQILYTCKSFMLEL